jgi:hypothetical protein
MFLTWKKRSGGRLLRGTATPPKISLFGLVRADSFQLFTQIESKQVNSPHKQTWLRGRAGKAVRSGALTPTIQNSLPAKFFNSGNNLLNLL